MRNWLKELRLLKNMNHEQVAELAGISRSHYTNIENGNKGVRVPIAKKIGKALDFDWRKFYDEEPNLNRTG